LIPHASAPLRLYGAANIQKDNIPLEPVMTCTGTPTYLLAKHLSRLLSPLV